MYTNQNFYYIKRASFLGLTFCASRLLSSAAAELADL